MEMDWPNFKETFTRQCYKARSKMEYPGYAKKKNNCQGWNEELGPHTKTLGPKTGRDGGRKSLMGYVPRGAKGLR